VTPGPKPPPWLAGPIDTDPTVAVFLLGELADKAERLAALGRALAGVELGAYDRRILEWLAGWDLSVVATVLSLLYRARAAGLERERPAGTVR